MKQEEDFFRYLPVLLLLNRSRLLIMLPLSWDLTRVSGYKLQLLLYLILPFKTTLIKFLSFKKKHRSAIYLLVTRKRYSSAKTSVVFPQPCGALKPIWITKGWELSSFYGIPDLDNPIGWSYAHQDSPSWRMNSETKHGKVRRNLNNI